MDFICPAHKKFFLTAIQGAETDAKRRALFYTLGLTPETRHHICDLYDFYHHLLKDDGLEKGWQNAVSIKVCRLAYNLYKGYAGMDSTDALLYTPFFLFDCELADYMLEAVRIRF